MILRQLFGTILLLIPFVLPVSADEATPVADQQGAFYTGVYPNLLGDAGISDADFEGRIDATWQQLFYGDDDSERVYYPVGDDLAYVEDINNGDVRSEGMSYGMMIAVQMNKKEEFDRLWKWAKTYMYHSDGPDAGYFSWHNDPDGTMLDQNPAPDGETWFAMALFFAAGRWGNGDGIFNYQAEANAILHTMLHKHEATSLATDMFDPTHKMVVYVPMPGYNSQFTDPSYHLPEFYELWARWADGDNDFWRQAAQISRDFWKTTADPSTGLMPDYAEFTGEPHPSGDYGEFFYSDAWRCGMNVAVDYSWFGADPWEVQESDRLLQFFSSLGIDQYNSKFKVDGTPANPQHRATALVATNATVALAASDDIKGQFIQAFWNAPLTTGQYRYYDDLLYFMALLHLSGRFQIYAPTTLAFQAG
jgi:oligosaccharide reducing-end xylanase